MVISYRSSPDPTLEEDPVHRKSLASGLYGTILVEPENGLPPVYVAMSWSLCCSTKYYFF